MVFHNVRRSGLRQVKSAVQAAKAYLQVNVKFADVKCSPEGGDANEKTAFDCECSQLVVEQFGGEIWDQSSA